MNYKIEKLSDIKYDKNAYEDLANQIYYLTDHLSSDYPKHYDWFFKKHLPFVGNGKREILFVRNHNNVCGVAFLKKEEDEKKICTFYVAEHGRNMGIGRTLMNASFEFLETTTPMITMPSEKVQYFLHFIFKNKWEITQIIEGYYVKDADEVVFNGKLEEKGYLTARGLTKWNASSIMRILQNSFYCGIIVYRKSYIPDYLEQKAKRNNGEVEQVIVDSKYPTIVSKKDFEKAQKLISEKSAHITENKKSGQKPPKSIWSKKVECACGSSFNKRLYHRYVDKPDTYYYQCYNQKNTGSARKRLEKGLDTTDACDIPSVQEWKLQLMASVVFNTIWGDKERIVKVANDLIDENIREANDNEELDAEIRQYSKKKEASSKKLEKLLDMYLSGDMIEKSEYIKKKKELDCIIEDLDKKIEELESEKNIPKDWLQEKIANLKQNIIDHLNWNEEKVSENIIDSFVEKIVVQDNRFEWKLNCLNDIINVEVEGRSNLSKVNLYNNTVFS